MHSVGKFLPMHRRYHHDDGGNLKRSTHPKAYVVDVDVLSVDIF